MKKKERPNLIGNQTKESDAQSVIFLNEDEMQSFKLESDLEFKNLNLEPERLKMNPDNPYKELKTDDYDRLKKDIKERGIIDPLIIDENYILLTGHNRLKIALELKLKSVPVRKLSSGISSEKKYKIMLLDNLNRRQLTPEEKIEFIKIAYGKQILKDNRGGDRSKPTNDGFAKKKQNTAEIISSETGISKRQAERIISKIKSEGKQKSQTAESSKLKIKALEKEIKSLESRLNAKKAELAKLKKK